MHCEVTIQSSPYWLWITSSHAFKGWNLYHHTYFAFCYFAISSNLPDSMNVSEKWKWGICNNVCYLFVCAIDLHNATCAKFLFSFVLPRITKSWIEQSIFIFHQLTLYLGHAKRVVLLHENVFSSRSIIWP